MARFDKFIADQSTAPQTNGHVVNVKKESHSADTKHEAKVKHEASVKQEANLKQERSVSPEKTGPQISTVPTPVKKRESTEVEESSEAVDAAPPKKKRKRTPVDDDAAFAAKLQAEENIRARPTRGGGPKKAVPIKKKKTPKKKTADRVEAADDSDMDSEAAEKKVNRSGGFHVGRTLVFERVYQANQTQKPLTLSAPLSALLDGQLQLSRPQTVKQIWEYVRRHDLQDPNDKRWIRCDDALKAVFKSEKVHMFTMNKLLAQNLYSPDE
ncbi:MAG: hypothetical protein Q9200_006304 [Gallowayella weberi]